MSVCSLLTLSTCCWRKRCGNQVHAEDEIHTSSKMSKKTLYGNVFYSGRSFQEEIWPDSEPLSAAFSDKLVKRCNTLSPADGMDTNVTRGAISSG